ncbi:hypothetical protein [Nitrospirillum sp. BR 11828]|uniref:hypothetical protein n=1 Tax=Nitrospirillum sp. BR 11828 TaxID=3104325 RepID=UPI002ACA5AF6|nr:hypothetical protein [Nitrospirillum sp. BR 11828]MDZ5650717.1 hypothetical protein [Nitrospirillum sp. BR 11828]
MRRGTRAHGDDQESYFASMSDLMAGIVFIFLIMLMALSMYNIDETSAPKDEQSEKTYQETIAKLMDERARMIEALRKDLQAHQIDASADAASGTLTLPAAQFFGPDATALKPEGREKMATTAALLARYLTCKADTPDMPDMPAGACPTIAPVERVDAAVIKATPPANGLAAQTAARIQALETSAALTSAQPTLYELQGRAGLPVLTVHGQAMEQPPSSSSVPADRHHRPAPLPSAVPPAVDRLILSFTMAVPPRS